MRRFIGDYNLEPEILRKRDQRGTFQTEVLLYYALEGSFELTVGDLATSGSALDFFVINTFDSYTFRGSENILYARFPIPAALLPHGYNGTTGIFTCNSARGSAAEAVEVFRGILNRLLRYYVLGRQDRILREQAEYEYCSWYFYMLGFLSTRFLSVSDRPASALSGDEKTRLRMARISSYLQEHYTEPVSLQDLSDHFYLSKSYLSRYFRQNYGMSLSDCLKKLRMDHAMELLQFTDDSVTRIAMNSGYPSVSLFNRVFRETFGKKPTDVRKELSQKDPEGALPASGAAPAAGADTAVDPGLVHLLMQNDLPDFRRIRAEKLSLVCEADRASAFSPIWNITLNAGPAEALLRSDFQEQIRYLQSTLHFTYARIWNVFSPEMLVLPSSGEGFNFTKLDRVIDFLLDLGLSPHFDLEEKESSSELRSRPTVLTKTAPITFADIGEWENLIRSFCDHLIRRYGGDLVQTWRVELIYDSFGLKGVPTGKSFFLLFKSAFRVIKHGLPRMQVGGCGYFPQYLLPSASRADFWAEWLRQAPAPDFVSMTVYGYEQDPAHASGYGQRTMDPDFLLHFADSLKQGMQEAGFPERRLCITEWNLTISDRNILKDTCFQGAYVLRNMILLSGSVSELAYFASTDLLGESYDTSGLLFGGNGLLSASGILKPSGYAFRFLNRLQGRLIAKSENYMVTTDGISWWSIVCHNMKDLGYYYYAMEEEKLTHADLWKIFDDRLPLEIACTLTGLPDAEYRIRTYRINEEHGSVCDIWKRFDFLEELQPGDIRAIRQESVPFMSMQTREVTNGRLLFDVRLLPNEICLIRIERYHQKET